MDWTTYVTQWEEAEYGKCHEHRTNNGLLLADDDIDCEAECPVFETCPFNEKKAEG